MADALTIEELRLLRAKDPAALHAHLMETRRAFLFGLEDHRHDPEGWGGEVRVVINRNVVVHFVPRLNSAMTTPVEFPQFTVVPSEERSDSIDDTVLKLDEGEEVQGATFYVDPTEYDALLGDADRILERYAEWEVIPDTYFLDGPLVQFITRTVLEHSAVRAEREYDFRRGFVGGEGPPALEVEEVEPAPDLEAWEQAGPAYTLDEELAEEEAEEGDDVDDDDEPDEDGRGGHFRTIKNPRA